MSINVTIKGAQKLAEGVWRVALEPAAARLFESNHTSGAGPTVLVLTQTPSFDRTSGALSFDPAVGQLLNVGHRDTAIILDGSSPLESTQQQNPARAETGLSACTDHPAAPEGAGDSRFLRALPDDLREIGTTLLASVRRQFRGDLKYFPTSGKFVEWPDNFWVVRIQPRDRSLRIVVRGRTDEFRVPSGIEMKKDMGSYSAFKISQPTQVRSAVDIICQASTKGRRGRRI